MKIRLSVCLFVIAFLVSAAAGLSAQQRTRYPLTVADDAGNKVVLRAAPTKIISLTLFTDEILLSLVDKSRLLGVTTFAVDPLLSNVADQAADVPNKLTMNVETIVSLGADLVIVANWSDAGPVKQLRDAGIPVYLMASGLTVKSIEEKIGRLGLLTGEIAKAQALIGTMEQKLAAVSSKVASVTADRKLSVLDYAPWGAAMGKGTSWDEIVRRAGLVNSVGRFTVDQWGQVPLSKEKILEIDPNILVLPGWVYGDSNGAPAFFQQIVGDPALASLSAVKADKVYMMPENLREATSQYITSAVEWLARTAYPSLFP
jgi:iron complex transport system substrate-binding protein